MDAPDQERTGVGDSALAVIGGALGCVGGLVGLVLSFAGPVLIFLVLVRGPGETWGLVKDNVLQMEDDEPCPGFDDWWTASEPRWERAGGQVERLVRREVDTPSEFRQLGTTFRQMAREQERSDPPAEVITYNGLLVSAFDSIADVAEALAADDYLGYREAYRQMEQVLEDGDAEDKRIRQLCL